MSELGVDPAQTVRAIRGAPRYLRQLSAYRELAEAAGSPVPSLADLSPAIADAEDTAAGMWADASYFYQDLWAARLIFERRPESHLDLGSRIDGFVSHVLAFMPVTAVDIRPMPDVVPGPTFIQADGTDLAPIESASVESLSSLNAVEHFGLGRYGDPLDPAGSVKGMRALSRVLAPGGRLYFAAPIGRERVCFNAHRIFSPTTVLDVLSDLELCSFAAVDEKERFRADADPADFDRNDGLGLFEFSKE